MFLKSIQQHIFGLALVLGVSFVAPVAQASGITPETRAELQLALREHISDNTAKGQYRYFDPESGETRLFQLKYLHTVMFEKDGFFLLCADFLDGENREVILDYVLHKSTDGFRVDQIVKGRRSFLMTVFERVF